MTMFADDKALYCHEDSPTNLQSKLNPDLSAITSWLSRSLRSLEAVANRANLMT